MNPRPIVLAIVLAGLALAPRAARAEATPGAAYSVEAKAATAQANVPAAATVLVTPGKGYHFNKEFPTSLKLEATPDVETPARLTGKDAGVRVAEDGASFEVRFTARTAGPKAVNGMLSFAVCTATTCEPRKQQVTLRIDVK